MKGWSWLIFQLFIVLILSDSCINQCGGTFASCNCIAGCENDPQSPCCDDYFTECTAKAPSTVNPTAANPFAPSAAPSTFSPTPFSNSKSPSGAPFTFTTTSTTPTVCQGDDLEAVQNLLSEYQSFSNCQEVFDFLQGSNPEWSSVETCSLGSLQFILDILLEDGSIDESTMALINSAAIKVYSTPASEMFVSDFCCDSCSDYTCVNNDDLLSEIANSFSMDSSTCYGVFKYLADNTDLSTDIICTETLDLWIDTLIYTGETCQSTADLYYSISDLLQANGVYDTNYHDVQDLTFSDVCCETCVKPDECNSCLEEIDIENADDSCSPACSACWNDVRCQDYNFTSEQECLVSLCDYNDDDDCLDNNTLVDEYGDTCESYYNDHPEECDYSDGTFSALENCCICQSSSSSSTEGPADEDDTGNTGECSDSYQASVVLHNVADPSTVTWAILDSSVSTVCSSTGTITECCDLPDGLYVLDCTTSVDGPNGGYITINGVEGQLCTDFVADEETEFSIGDTPSMFPSGVPTPLDTGGCYGICGSQNKDEKCYCDELCVNYGDCCYNYEKYCLAAPPTSAPTPYCEDIYDACNANNPDHCGSGFIQYCLWTCEACGQDFSDTCEDTFEGCTAMGGYCHLSDVQTNCPKTCGVCGEDVDSLDGYTCSNYQAPQNVFSMSRIDSEDECANLCDSLTKCREFRVEDSLCKLLEEDVDGQYKQCFKEATCDDGLQNGFEEGVDCGGACAPCQN